MSDARKAILLGLLAVLIWSTVATAFKMGLRQVDHFQLLFLAHVFSLLALGLVLGARRGFGLLRQVSREQRLICAGLGLLNPFLYYLVLFKAYALLPAQVAQPLNQTWALTLSWLAWPILGQRLGRRDVLAGLVCYGGVVLIMTGGDLGGFRVDSVPGVVLALASTLIWALYWLGNTRLRIDAVVGLFLSFVFSLPVVALTTALFSDFRFPGPGVAWGAYIGAFEMGFTFVLWLSALRLTDNTSRVANLIFLAPFLSKGHGVGPDTDCGGLAVAVSGPG